MGVSRKDNHWYIDYYPPDGKRKKEPVTIPGVDHSKVTRRDTEKAESIRKAQLAEGKFEIAQTDKRESKRNNHNVILVILLFLFSTFPARAEDIEFRNIKEESVPEYVFKTLPKNLLIGTKESLWGWNLVALGAAAGVAIPLSQTDADEEIQDAADGSLGDFSKIGDIGGDGLTLAGIAASTYIVGKVIKDEKVTETGEALIEGQIIRAVMTKVIKVSVGRERPNGSDDRFSSSFPSGHASGTFALASTVDAMYGHKIGIPLYMFAAFSSYSRLSDDKHFLSDVLFGAVLGTVVGRAVAKVHKEENYNKFSIFPYSDKDSAGLIFVLSW